MQRSDQKGHCAILENLIRNGYDLATIVHSIEVGVLC